MEDPWHNSESQNQMTSPINDMKIPTDTSGAKSSTTQAVDQNSQIYNSNKADNASEERTEHKSLAFDESEADMEQHDDTQIKQHANAQIFASSKKEGVNSTQQQPLPRSLNFQHDLLFDIS